MARGTLPIQSVPKCFHAGLCRQKLLVTASLTLGLFCSCCQRHILFHKHLASVFSHGICGFNKLPPGKARRRWRDFPREWGCSDGAWQDHHCRAASPWWGTGRPCLLIPALWGTTQTENFSFIRRDSPIEVGGVPPENWDTSAFPSRLPSVPDKTLQVLL